MYDFAKSGQLPDLTAPNMGNKGEAGPTFFGAYGAWMQTPPPSWEDVAWLRQQWEGAFMLKGVSRIDDAKRAVDAGVTAISVSNHGGNNLDGTPATIRVLQPIAQTVGGQVEVLLDGGIRRGSDVVKALALGARAVMIGRAYLWGLAANGQAGVENVLDILRSGIESTLLGLGHAFRPRPQCERRDHSARIQPPPRGDAVRRSPPLRVERDDAPDDRAGGLIVVALLHLVEGVLTGDDLVDLELTVLVEVEQIGHLHPRARRAEDSSQQGLVVHGEVEEIQL